VVKIIEQQQQGFLMEIAKELFERIIFAI